MRVVALTGGVGGAKLVDGLARCLKTEDLTIIVNTGDDFYHYGLKICPDLDTVCYTLAGLANPDTGWGRSGDSFNMMNELALLGGETWFKLGDKDLATHLERTRHLHAGRTLSTVCNILGSKWGIKQIVLPMTEDEVRTFVHTRDHGKLSFQDYFVREACMPVVTGFLFEGIGHARPTPGMLESLEQADLIVFCPSNPWVSIGPILSISGVKEVIRRKKALAVSPIVGGNAIKGPAAKMFSELGITPSVLAVARYYEDLLWGLVIDERDAIFENEISGCGIISLITNTIMKTIAERERLAKEVVGFWTTHKASEEHN
jgi:LPPG:FO 2-phospho-L-lactate transferase